MDQSYRRFAGSRPGKRDAYGTDSTALEAVGGSFPGKASSTSVPSQQPFACASHGSLPDTWFLGADKDTERAANFDGESAAFDLMNVRPSILGVFDSGFGGLTVLKALLELIPEADYLYFGDTARLPYGSKSAETVARYAVEAAHYLQSHGAQLLVVACNTATALALDQIKAGVEIPVVGVVEPGAEAAAAVSQNKKVVVIGTEATISSHAYRRALNFRGLHVTEKACPLLVPLIEEGWVDHPVTEEVSRIYIREVFANEFRDADTLVLGCTHYPLIKQLLRRVVPDHVSIVDSAESTAKAVVQNSTEFLRPASPELSRVDDREQGHSHLKFFATDSVEKFRRLGARFLGHSIADVQLVDLKE